MAIEDLLHALDDLLLLEPDWDEDGAPRIDPSSVARAQNLVSRIEFVTRQAGWERPSVGPMCSGGVSIHWRIAGEIHWLIIDPNKTAVIYVHDDEQRGVVREEIPCEDTIKAIAQVLQNKSR